MPRAVNPLATWLAIALSWPYEKRRSLNTTAVLSGRFITCCSRMLTKLSVVAACAIIAILLLERTTEQRGGPCCGRSSAAGARGFFTFCGHLVPSKYTPDTGRRLVLLRVKGS